MPTVVTVGDALDAINNLTPHTATAQFGIEYELFPRGHPEVADYVEQAYEAGLTNSDHRHEYHCGCDACDYERSGPLMACQRDSSVGVEFVSRILNVNNPHDLDEVERWVAFNEAWKAGGGWMPDGHTSAGDHIHVESRHLDAATRQASEWSLLGAYAAYDWDGVADGGCGRLREYNQKPSTDRTGSWFYDHGETFEHRLWNTPADPQRLWVHVGLSVALTRWSADAATLIPLDDMRRDAGWGYYPQRGYVDTLLNNRDIFVEGVIARLPDDPRFAVAADVLRANLHIY